MSFRRKERVQFDKVRCDPSRAPIRTLNLYCSLPVQITARISKLCYGLDNNHVDPTEYVWSSPSPLTRGFSGTIYRVAQKVIQGVYQGVTTSELDVSRLYCIRSVLHSNDIRARAQNLAAETAAYLTTKHPDYAILAARIAVSNLHKDTKKNFSHVITDLYNYGELPRATPCSLTKCHSYP